MDEKRLSDVAETAEEPLVFKLAHVGINTNSVEESEHYASLLSKMFCVQPRAGNNSNFVSDMFEILKFPMRGTHGHIAMHTNSVTRAIEHLAAMGVEADMSTAKYREDGTLRFVYLKNEICGFAFHLNLM